MQKGGWVRVGMIGLCELKCRRGAVEYDMHRVRLEGGISGWGLGEFLVDGGFSFVFCFFGREGWWGI